MRKLQTKDVFNVMRVIRKANIKEELRPIIAKASQKGADAGNIGIEAFLSILEALADQGAEKQIYEFLSGPFELTPKEIEALDIETLSDMFRKLGEENNLIGFFDSLAGLMNSKSLT